MTLLARRNRLSTSTKSETSLEERVMLMGSATKSGAKSPPKKTTTTYTQKDAELLDSADSEKASGLTTDSGGGETFTVAKGENKEPLTEKAKERNPGLKSGLDARVERGFVGDLAVKNGKGNRGKFSGKLSVEQANKTTVFQILSNDPDAPDTETPVVKFDATVEKVKGKKGKNKGKDIKVLKIYDDADGDNLVYSGSPLGINIEADVKDGKSAVVKLNGKVVVDRNLDRDSKKTGDQPGKQQVIRFGNYHHDRKRITDDEIKSNKNNGDKDVEFEARTTAIVRYSGVKYELTK